jgi:hypothetical protein
LKLAKVDVKIVFVQKEVTKSKVLSLNPAAGAFG